MRIAVIDSGVHPGHPHIVAGQLLPGVAIAADGSLDLAPDCTLDRLGHGTAVTAAIQERAGDAMVIPIRVFREHLRASARALVTAIGWAVDCEADIINCSLGTGNPAHAALFDAAVARAVAAGVRVVAPATGADDAPCWPGQSPGTLRVALDWDLPRGVVVQSGGLHHAAGYPRPIPGMPETRNLHGISFATAQVTGWLAAGA